MRSRILCFLGFHKWDWRNHKCVGMSFGTFYDIINCYKCRAFKYVEGDRAFDIALNLTILDLLASLTPKVKKEK